METWLTHALSQLPNSQWQQTESAGRGCVTHGPRPVVRAMAVWHLSCAQLPLPPQLKPQTEATSLTQVLSQELLQQYGSTAQICVTHGSQPLVRATPV